MKRLLGKNSSVLAASAILLVLFCRADLSGQDPGYVRLFADPETDALELETVGSIWRYRPGDDLGWADPAFDDSGWRILSDARLSLDKLEEYDWKGVAWFRLRIQVDPAIADRPLTIRLRQLGASEVFLNGKRVLRFGTVGTSKADEVTHLARYPGAIVFPGSGQHVIAIRYSNFYFTQNPLPTGQVGFGISLGDANTSFRSDTQDKLVVQSRIVRYLAVMFSFAALHLILFLFSPKVRSNLYFAVFCAGIGTFIPLDIYTFNLLDDPTWTPLLTKTVQLVGSTAVIFGLFLVYEIFYHRRPRQAVWLVAAAAGLTLLTVLGLAEPSILQFTFLAFMVEVGRVVILAIARRSDGAWIVGAGFLVFAISGSMVLLRNLGWLPSYPWLPDVSSWGLFGILASMSIYLARSHARTNQALEERLIEVKQLSRKALEQERRARQAEVQQQVLEAENRRTSQELEEARRLQLAMLPQTLPELSRLEMAAHMETASEVGGDYYDFSLSADGELTIAVGDATGHGAKAGTMVATAKGLFQVLSSDASIVAIFRRLGATLKEMRLGRMYMALAIVKYKDGIARIGSAGMPPALHYRAAEGRIEEISLPAMPLGSFPDFPYQERELRLDAHDALILMSDGLPETFNRKGEIFDYGRTRAVAQEAAGRSPKELIDHLLSAGRTWAEGRPNDDDITLLVLKRKPT